MRSPIHHHGMTMIEVLLAVVILGAATTIGVGGMGAIQKLSMIEQDRLNAMEVAHRLLLNHMIDPDSLPEPERPIAQGTGVYRYAIEVAGLQEEETGSRRSSRKATPLEELTGNQRLQAGLVMATVNVYRYRGPGPVREQDKIAELTRIYDPFDTDEETIMFNQLESLMGINAPGARR